MSDTTTICEVRTVSLNRNIPFLPEPDPVKVRICGFPGNGVIPPDMHVTFSGSDGDLSVLTILSMEASKALRLALLMVERSIQEAEYIRKLNEHTARKAVAG